MYDILILGGGPAGYLAAERAGSRGMQVLLVERERLGGVCLNHGCIPTKSLIHSAKLFSMAKKAGQFGVSLENPGYDLSIAMAWKEKTVQTLVKGVAYQMEKHHVTVVEGEGRVRDRNTFVVDGKTYKGDNLIIATGSSSVRLPIPGADKPHVMTSREILQIKELPRSLVIAGGGAIGMEFASFFSMIGVSVTVIELLPEIIPNLDGDVASLLRRALPEVTFHLNCRLESIEDDTVTFLKDGEKEQVDADMVLISTGRTPNTRDIGLEPTGIDFDRSGIRVNDRMQTNISNVYAIGDVNGLSLLAHSAYRMAEVAVRIISGENDMMRYEAVPWVVYTNPELAGVGLTEAEAKRLNKTIKIGKLPLRVNGRFIAEFGRESGICKVIVDAGSNRLLGVQMFGAQSSEMIFGAAAMIESELRIQDIKDIIFPHPTVSEIIKDTLWEIE